jgi:hypothetical protein
VSLTSKLRVLFVCLVLQVGVIGAVPMRPEEIEELLHEINQPMLAHVLPTAADDGDDPQGGPTCGSRMEM